MTTEKELIMKSVMIAILLVLPLALFACTGESGDSETSTDTLKESTVKEHASSTKSDMEKVIPEKTDAEKTAPEKTMDNALDSLGNAAGDALKTVENLTLDVQGMTCEHCVNTVTNALMDCPGVTSVKVDLEKKIAELTGTALNASALAAVLKEVGYEAKVKDGQ